MSRWKPPLRSAAWRFLPALAAAFAFALSACGDDPAKPHGDPLDTDRVADFSLMDVNPNSPTGGRAVSPRDFLGKISAWYFGYST